MRGYFSRSNGSPLIPDIPGRPISISATSGTGLQGRASASSMDRNAPVQPYPSLPLMSAARPSRIRRSSSMIATRIGTGEAGGGADSFVPMFLNLSEEAVPFDPQH